MARIRTIKPEFWTDSKTGTLSGLATKLFLGILNHCDDYGVIKMDLMELKAKILPYEPGDSLVVITPLLFDELLPKCLLTLFQYSDKDEGVLQQYLYVSNFLKHQRIDKPGLPIIDKWLKTDCLDSFMARIAEHSTNLLVTFSPERKGKEGNGSIEPKPKTNGASAFVRPDWIDSETWDAFEEMRKKIRKPMTDQARKNICSRLLEFKNSKGDDPGLVLQQSITNSWQDVFELRRNKQTSLPVNPPEPPNALELMKTKYGMPQ